MGSEFSGYSDGEIKMSNTQVNITWNKIASDKYNKMVARIPIFHRELVKQVVPPKAESLARARGASEVSEEDIVKAFLHEVPKAFYSLMVRLLDEVGFEYKQLTSKK